MDRLFIELVNDWKQFHGKWNWYTFTFINIEFENVVMTHGYEFYFVVLGLGIRIRYNKASYEQWEQEMKEDIDNNKDLMDIEELKKYI